MSSEFVLPFDKWREKHLYAQHVYLSDIWYNIELPYIEVQAIEFFLCIFPDTSDR